MEDTKYIVINGKNLTLKCGGGIPTGYIFGIDEVRGERQQETINYLLEKKVINQLEPEPEPEVTILSPRYKPEPAKKKRGRPKSKK